MAKKSYYDVLGVPRSATDKDVRQAYRRLARKYHPDVNPGDKGSEERFKGINEAYGVLSDPEKRRKYDRYGDDWSHADQIQEEEARMRRGGSVRGSGPRAAGPSVRFDTGPGGLFDQLFTNLGDDLQSAVVEYPVQLTLEEAFQGATRRLELPGGRRLEVKIPAGVDTGSRIHIGTEAGRQGDIYLLVSVLPHSRFQRQGRDLHCEVEVPLEDAILGGETAVPTLKGRVALTIPAEAQNGQRFRLAGQGMPGLNQPAVRGDLYAILRVILPTGLTAQERDLYRQLKELRATRRK